MINDRAFLTTCARGQFRKLAWTAWKPTNGDSNESQKRGWGRRRRWERVTIDTLGRGTNYTSRRCSSWKWKARSAATTRIRHPCETVRRINPPRGRLILLSSLLAFSRNEPREAFQQWSIWHDYSIFEIFDWRLPEICFPFLSLQLCLFWGGFQFEEET